MSGIAGIYYLDGRPVERMDVERMVDSISHRGPDGSGVWTDGSIGFGHRMLWTTPESLHEKLPLTNKTGDLTITADARIDNRDELIPALNLNGRPRETITDSEIILAAYEKWSEKCPEKLLGDFSFVIWDKRKQTVFCARDPIGIKPFYYYFKDGKFRWSSEPKAIFEDSEIPKEPNLQLICLYLLNRFDEREQTLYKDIYRLPPSHFMVIENGKIRKDQYWDIDPNHAIRYKTDAEYAEHFLSLFKEAVKVRLRSHGSVGALLSGGLDSSSIVCTAAKLYQDGVIPNNGFETFSIVFDTFPCDERTYINEVVNKWDIKANYFPYEKNLSWLDFEQTYKYQDVVYIPNILFSGPAFKGAQQKQMRVMLDGLGGDNLLAVDFDHLTDLLLKREIRQLMVQLRHDATLLSYSPYTIFFNYCVKPLIPRPIKMTLNQIIKPLKGNGIPSWINRNYLKRTEISKCSQNSPMKIHFSTRSQQRIYEMLLYSWNMNIALDMFERFIAFFGIESRHPFFDRRLMEFLLAIPEEQRWRSEWPKMVLRKAMDRILPKLIRNRKDKAEFSGIVDHAVKQNQANKLDELMHSSTLVNLGLIHGDRFNKLLEVYRRGITSNDMRNSLETVIWLELWYRSQWAT